MGRKLTQEQFEDRVYSINKNVLILEEYKNLRQKVKTKCKVCGTVWYPYGCNLATGHGCPSCKLKYTSQLFTIDKNTYLKTLYERRPDIIINESEYFSGKSILNVRCKICNYEWKSIAYDLLRTKNCPVCKKKSYGESVIEKWLINNGIKYIPQYHIKDLRGIRGGFLSYDFYIPGYNLLIEYQGEQHYKAIDYFGGEEKFKLQQLYDKQKKEYAKTNNLNLLEISYKDDYKINQILEERMVMLNGLPTKVNSANI